MLNNMQTVTMLLLMWMTANFYVSTAFVVPTSMIKVRSHFTDKRNSLISRPPTFIEQRSSMSTLHGIPKLFRWLVDLYPHVMESVDEGLSSDAMSVDKFYLDMNGIIHTCTHSNNDKLVPLNEQEMFLRIFAYTDRLYKLVKPKKLIFLAIDGVAPRAKMNQQRSRRFRSAKEREALLADHVAREGQLPDVESFDSNCITPGTDFMHRLSIAFRRWITYKMKTDVFWQRGAEVVFSGPDVPGEGEHKIMDMIRYEKASDPRYDPGKYRHMMYGLDADLIMLSLATHEKHFTLLREKIRVRNQPVTDVLKYTQEDFELLEISTLRSTLQMHMEDSFQDKPSGSKVFHTIKRYFVPKNVTHFDIERVVDDFVFICFLIGNDFVPGLPHLDISDGSLNMVMNIYAEVASRVGYLTDKEKLHLPRIEILIQEVARREPLYFMQKGVEEKENDYMSDKYRDTYYKAKFDIEPGDEKAIRHIVQSYVEGLAWILTYYHKGCGSWSWYYPYLYAPLASDVKNFADMALQFEKGKPFTPLLQLLSVLPPQSGKFLPPPYFKLMNDEDSPLIDYYPTDFTVDQNGKANAWECVVNIPFIEEDVLVDTISKIDHNVALTEVEKKRNEKGNEHRFMPPTKVMMGGAPSHNPIPAKGVWGNALASKDDDDTDKNKSKAKK